MILGFKIGLEEKLRWDYHDLGFHSFVSNNEEIQEILKRPYAEIEKCFSDP